MIKIAIYKLKESNGILVILKSPKGNLVGEYYHNGIYKRGRWDERATFTGRDAEEYRVKEYFGFTSSNSFAYWKRWA